MESMGAADVAGGIMTSEDVIKAVMNLHTSSENILDGRPFGSVLKSIFCDECNTSYPCKTIKVIKGIL